VIGQLRSELLKQRSTPTTLYLFLGMLTMVALAVAGHVLALSTSSLSTHTRQIAVFEVGTRAGMLFAGLAGALAITAEIRYGTIRPTFLVEPRRSPVIAAKLAIGGLVGILYGLIAEGLMAAAATIAFPARGIPNMLTGGDYTRIVVGGAAAAALWAIIGVGVGALVRNQVATLVGLFAWTFLVEGVIEGFFPGFTKLLPAHTGLALTGNGANKLPVAAAALLLIGYAVAASAAGWRGTLRRDVA
jgi:ABC-2 type transport system permease protein